MFFFSGCYIIKRRRWRTTKQKRKVLEERLRSSRKKSDTAAQAVSAKNNHTPAGCVNSNGENMASSLFCSMGGLLLLSRAGIRQRTTWVGGGLRSQRIELCSSVILGNFPSSSTGTQTNARLDRVDGSFHTIILPLTSGGGGGRGEGNTNLPRVVQEPSGHPVRCALRRNKSWCEHLFASYLCLELQQP